jgi:hypothetical protein
MPYSSAYLGTSNQQGLPLSRVKRYLERAKTRLTHQGEVARVYGYTSFASAEAELG